jgi:LacI family transcriptional regulator
MGSSNADRNMNRRPTIADVAKAAGLSVATVDRALNGRHRVRDETLRRIYEASTAIGYHAAGLLKRRLTEDLPHYTLGLLVLGHTHPAFFKALARQFEATVSDFPSVRGIAKIDYLNWESPVAVAEQLRQMGTRTQAVAAVSIDHPTITAVVAELKTKGVPVFSVLTDFAQGVRESYVGLNNRKAGSTAAWLISKTARRPGKVALFVGSSRFHGHEMREIGFRAYFRERAPEFQVIDTLVNPGPAELAYDATRALLRECPDLVGLNVAGCGPEGVIQALREARMAGKLTAICNECTPDSTAALADDVITMVIDTPLDWLCRELVSLMVRAIDRGAAHTPGQAFVPFSMLVSENI